MPRPNPTTATRANGGGYGLEIDGEEPCGRANVCLYALFTGRRGGKRYGTQLRQTRRSTPAPAERRRARPHDSCA